VEADRITRAADQIEKVVAGQQAGEGPHPAALAHLTSYVTLLRTNVTGSPRVRCLFKLELADGRWDVAEHELSATPTVGDEVRLDAKGTWRVDSTALVGRARGPKDPHRVFVCTLAA
jgi:hypothetical protein